MKLLEIVRAADTSDATVARAREFGAKFGKDSILVKDAPGFASSRLGVCIGLEAMRMLEQGVASAEDIDKAMKLGYGFPMGPLELTDLVGLDVRLDIANYLHAELKSEVFRPPEILKRLVAEGKLGKKSKQGFYKHV
jgi:3-hydroxybutyryl-CoA dehydrogenase